ncbi:GntP family permease [Asaccharospora irregularis]|uniref:Gluconate:H+ symporter, GntP family n=1 Tax=Asaccharospora irregularis DSM 2635 TaxID=1121321 RepID=A0A1M5K7C1_9FIRM|nr:GntP family permease [Asaccharospora irregularis]SHG48409.1 gluconate:H+ symporter, GntP family [Asaccharospora irregularis DSM 2635]
MEGITVSGPQILLGLGVGIALLILMMLKTKMHPFLAMIISASVTGLIGGMPATEVVNSITKGFGNTLGSIGIIIGFGVMMGEIFEVSGAAKKMAQIFVKKLGKGREELALAITGFLVSIPIFCDSGFVILSPLAKSISRSTGKSVISLGLSLALGLVITHSLVPPTPGPVGVAGIYGANVGTVLLLGIICAIPMTLAGLTYAKYLGKKMYRIPTEDGEGYTTEFNQAKTTEMLIDENEKLPSGMMAFMPIVAPIVLILINTVVTQMGYEGSLVEYIKFFGSPVIAVAIGLIISIYGLGAKYDKKEITTVMEKGIKSAGVIMLVTGAGGALGMIIRDSGAGDYIASLIAQTPLPAFIIPFAIASIVRLIQGSGTVAMTTAASVTAPMMASLGLSPEIAVLSACIGSLVFSHFNDSYFWVVNRTLGVTEVKEQIRVYSIASTIVWAVGFVELIILNIFI